MTASAGALPGSQGLNALTWLGTVATVAALIVAVGIYRVQRRDQNRAHGELLGAIRAQDQILADFAQQVEPEDAATTEGEGAPVDDNTLTPEQRAKVEEVYGEGSIAAAWRTGAGRGNRPRLVRLTNGKIVSVYSGGRSGGTYVHELRHDARTTERVRSVEGVRGRPRSRTTASLWALCCYPRHVLPLPRGRGVIADGSAARAARPGASSERANAQARPERIGAVRSDPAGGSALP